MALINIVPYQNKDDVKSANETLTEVRTVVGVEGCTPALEAAQFTGSTSWNDAYQKVVWPVAQSGSLVGVNLQDSSRLILNDAINDEEKRQLMKDFILELPAEVPFIWQNSTSNLTSDVSSNLRLTCNLDCGNEANKVAKDAVS